MDGMNRKGGGGGGGGGGVDICRGIGKVKSLWKDVVFNNHE